MKSQCTTKPLSLAVAVLLASLGNIQSLQAEPFSAESPIEGLLVLRNGNLLRGKVYKQSDYYHVQLAKGQLQVRAEQVENFCKTIDQAYELRRHSRGGSSADSHLELAGWCLRHNLFDYAKQELQEAKATDPNHPRLAYLQRHLEQTIKIAVLKKEQAQQQAKAEVVTKQPPPNPETLEKAPQWARALFVRQIQPLVVQSCATTGCHQCGSDSNFQLNRLALDGAGHPKVTLQNLAATLEQIDWQTANQSALLLGAKKAHGGADASVPLAPHKLKVLESWIDQLATAHQKKNELEQQQNDLHQLPPVIELAALPGPELQLVAPVQHDSQPQQVQQTSYEPADPFDPSAFNRSSNTAEEQPAVQQTVPHVLAPSEPILTPLPAVE